MWVAPSGGRDRPNGDGEWLPAPFDPSAVELMRTLLGKAKRPGHLYPFAMSSWEIMPPPQVHADEQTATPLPCNVSLRTVKVCTVRGAAVLIAAESHVYAPYDHLQCHRLRRWA